uniref:HAD-IC family P-type ATPase n=1 Tax=uncultured Streptococcus sp. TaxID=83427 RepID=UPI002582B4CB
AGELSMTDYKAELLPADKVTELENYLAQKHSRSTVGFVGDGINDAPVLARADVGIAMGGLGSDVAIEAADVVVMNDRLSKIAQAIKIARKTITIARENIVFSIGIKVLVLILASLGLANMWLAIFADVGVTVLATLNAMQTMKLT